MVFLDSHINLFWSNKERIDNLSNCFDGFVRAGGYQVNVNVLHKETLLEAMEHPEKYPS